jgi:hypothetical protein
VRWGAGDEAIEPELAHLLENGVELAEVGAIARVAVVVVEVLAEPGAPGWPVSPRPVNGSGRAPEVGIVVSHPAADAVKKSGATDSLDTRLEAATEEVYSAEFHRGVMSQASGPLAGLTVGEAKEKAVELLTKTARLGKMLELPENQDEQGAAP